MALPLVILFERHWDVPPRELLINLLPSLIDEGYDTLCFEAPHDSSEEQIVAGCRYRLEEASEMASTSQKLIQQRVKLKGKLSDLDLAKLTQLIQLYVSSKKYDEVATKIKHLPAISLLNDILTTCEKNSIFVEGIDIKQTDYSKINKFDYSRDTVTESEAYRIQTFTANLLRLHQKREGLIFCCGGLHAAGLMASLKEQKIENVLYYFPHSPKFLYSGFDDIRQFHVNETTKGHIYSLSSESEIRTLAQRVVKEIKSRNTHHKAELLQGTSHSAYLSKFFGVTFSPFLRPGHYVDLLVRSENAESIKEIFQNFQIPTQQILFREHQYLVVPNVNTREVGEKVMKIFS